MGQMCINAAITWRRSFYQRQMKKQTDVTTTYTNGSSSDESSYQWYILTAAFFVAVYAVGVVHYGFTAIFKPIADELNWTYTQVSLAASLRGMEMGLLAPVIGIIVDRWPTRKIILSGSIILFVGFVILSRCENLATFYFAFILVALGMSCSSMTVLMSAVMRWFPRKRGLASGIAVSGFGASGIMIPFIVYLVQTFGWRTAVVMLGVGAVVFIGSLSFVFKERAPSSGNAKDDKKTDGKPRSPKASPQSVTYFMAKREFWHIAVAFMFNSLMISTVATHIMPYLINVKVDVAMASIIAPGIPLFSIVGRIVFGWMADRTSLVTMSVVSFILMGLGVLCLAGIVVANMWLLSLFVLLFGVGYGGGISLRPMLLAHYFGTVSFGTVFGLTLGVNMIGVIFGAPFAGCVFDFLHTYRPVWFVFVFMCLAAALSIYTIPTAAHKKTEGVI